MNELIKVMQSILDTRCKEAATCLPEHKQYMAGEIAAWGHALTIARKQVKEAKAAKEERQELDVREKLHTVIGYLRRNELIDAFVLTQRLSKQLDDEFYK